MKKIKLLENWNVFEFVFLIFGVIILCATAIITKSSFISSITSLTLFIVAVFQAKGFVVAQIFNIIALFLYMYLSYTQQYYGECLICLFCTLPISIYGIYSWYKNKDGGNNNGFIKQENIKKKEWIIFTILGIGLLFVSYFLLKYLNTNQLIISTFSITLGVFATYLISRRSLYGFYFYIIKDIMLIILWTLATFPDHLELLPMVFTMILFIINDIYAIIHWYKEKKNQDI